MLFSKVKDLRQKWIVAIKKYQSAVGAPSRERLFSAEKGQEHVAWKE